MQTQTAVENSILMHTESEDLRENARQVQRRYRTLMRSAQDIIAFVNAAGEILAISDSIEEASGFSPDQLLGRNAFKLIHPDDRETARAIIEHAFSHPGSSKKTDLRFSNRDQGYSIYEVIGGQPPTTSGSHPEEVAVISREVTQRRELERKLIHLSIHDPLTGLANRRQLESRLKRAKQGSADGSAAILFLDLDDFKLVNDSLGHEVGDQLLKAVAGRLKQATREQDLVARLGGDEFAVLLTGVDGGSSQPHKTAQRLLESLRQPFDISGNRISVGASIGLACSATVNGELDRLLAAGDVAMYKAKRSDSTTLAVFNPESDWTQTSRWKLREEVRRAILEKTLRLTLQPICDLWTGAVKGAEAMPVLDLVKPPRELPNHELFALALEAHLESDLTRCTLEMIQKLWLRWRKQDLRLDFFSLNVSPQALIDSELRRHLLEILRDGPLSASQLILEVQDPKGKLAQKVPDAAPLPVALALDEFASDRTCWVSLQDHVFSSVKISSAWTQRASEDRRFKVVTRHLTQMLADLNATSIALGVETLNQLYQLRHLGCLLGQGRFFSPPLAPESFLHFARRRQTLSERQLLHAQPANAPN